MLPLSPRRVGWSFIEQEAIDLGGDQFELWVLEIAGKRRLPAFSSEKKMEEFSGIMSKHLDKFFSLGCIEILLADVIKNLDVESAGREVSLKGAGALWRVWSLNDEKVEPDNFSRR